ncbi:hypothetical protein GA0115240_117028 [Streptomyces sp. DvalAA-14]|jgi:hypothetical protein|uniref:hypothetical protein n=1 Tax=unclassified Streptomyces TaxID=2593676 RepID=UPI00081B2A1A|nr:MULTISPECIES: hypothetical protein [unclassified Streptomyces]MYS20163.1 hypothetical protein [Streptomyces sp. SID4948]SCD62285.1 hypothetical protein GA0115240_117028 [Streptomyces sp. DvalAA-14]
MSNPTPQPDNNYDPAGNTQMFRAFVDEQPPPAQVQRAETRSRAGLIIGVIVALVVIVGVVALAMK